MIQVRCAMWKCLVVNLLGIEEMEAGRWRQAKNVRVDVGCHFFNFFNLVGKASHQLYSIFYVFLD